MSGPIIRGASLGSLQSLREVRQERSMCWSTAPSRSTTGAATAVATAAASTADIGVNLYRSSTRPADAASSPPADGRVSRSWQTWAISAPTRPSPSPHRRPGQELTVQKRSLSKSHARFRYPVGRGMARLKAWRIFRRARCSPTWLTAAAQLSSPWRATATAGCVLGSGVQVPARSGGLIR